MSRSNALAMLPAFFLLTCGEALAQSIHPVPDPGAETRLDDVVVTGVALEEQAEAFVSSVGGAVRGRKLATWSEPVSPPRVQGATTDACEPLEKSLGKGPRSGHGWCICRGKHLGIAETSRTILEPVQGCEMARMANSRLVFATQS